MGETQRSTFPRDFPEGLTEARLKPTNQAAIRTQIGVVRPAGLEPATFGSATQGWAVQGATGRPPCAAGGQPQFTDPSTPSEGSRWDNPCPLPFPTDSPRYDLML